MNFLHYEMDAGPDDPIEVSIDHPANVQLMDPPNFRNYKNRKEFRYFGGHAEASPVRLPPPRQGHWHLAIDLGGGPGRSGPRWRWSTIPSRGSDRGIAGRMARFFVRCVAYGLPFAVPVVAVLGRGRSPLAADLLLVGYASLGLVQLFCRPTALEYRVLMMLAVFWLVVTVRPVLFLDRASSTRAGWGSLTPLRGEPFGT